MVADFAGHPPILVGNPVVAMGLDSTIDSSACSDSKENTEFNTAMATDMDLKDSASGVVLDKDPAAASDSAKDSESLDLNVASDKGSDTVPIQLSVSATAIASLIATQDSDDSNGRFSGSSSEENEFTDDDDITKANKKRKIESSSSSRKKVAFDNCDDKSQKKE